LTGKRTNFWLIPFALIGACWRRWYGGGFGKAGLVTRFWKYLVLAVVVFGMYFAKSALDWLNWRMYSVVAAFAYHWARSHGDYFFVYSTAPDEGRIKWIDWVLRKLYGENGYFNFKGNVTGLFLRYTATACVVCVAIPDWRFVFAGVLTTLSYVVTGRMKYSTNWAEWIAGALNFGLLYVCL
jgi:hypothetical protein